MRKHKSIIGVILSLVIVCSMSVSISAASTSGSFTTTGGDYNKTWNYSISSEKIASAFYRMNGSIKQPDIYKFDKASIRLTLFCEGTTNVVKTVSGEDTYSLSASCDASTGYSNGTGSLRAEVSDDTYGSATKIFYLQ